MADLHLVLQSLPPGGVRLPRGLALRMSYGNGMAVLGCSRIGTKPSDEEMETVQTAVQKAFAPDVLLQADNISLSTNEDGEHHIRRLYWPCERISVVWRPVTQKELFS